MVDEINGVFEIYDRALVEFLKITLEGEAEHIPIVFATGSRAFQRLTYLYQEMQKRIKTPVMAVYRSAFTIADNRFFFNPEMWVSFDKTGNRCNTAQSPQAIDIPYNLDIRCEKTKTMSQIQQKMTRKFIKDIGYVTVNLGAYGDQYFSLQHTGNSDSNELEPGEQDKKLRETTTLQFRGYVFREVEAQRVMKTVTVDYYDDLVTPEQFLESQEIITVE